MKKLTLLSAVFAVCLLAGCENPIYQWLLPEKQDPPSGPLDMNAGWKTADGQGAFVRSLWAQGGDTKVTLYWADPSHKDFDHVEILYSASYSDVQSAAPSCTRISTGDQSVRKAEIEGLKNGTPYYFAVTPMNDQNKPLGQALVISATPHSPEDAKDRPDDVESLVSNPGSGYTSLSWNLPATHATAEPLSPKQVAKVEVSIVPREGTVEPAANMKGAYLAGLQNAVPYTIYIRTVNADGKKSYGVSTVLIPSGSGSGSQDPSGGLDDKAAVKNLQAKAGSGQVTLFWEDPVTPCDGLKIYYALDDGNAYDALMKKVEDDWEEGRAAVTPYGTAETREGREGKVITGLDNDKLYFFAIAPVKSGKVINSPVIVSAKPLEDDPQRAADVEKLRSTPMDGGVLLAWTLPAAIADIPPEDIEVVIELDKEHSATNCDILGPESAYIDGLINGTLYNITVRIKYAEKNQSAGVSTAAIPQAGSGAGGEEDETSLVIQTTKTNIRVAGGILDILRPGSKRTFIPVVVNFTDGTWYDGHFRSDGEVFLNYPADRVRRIFASMYLVAEDDGEQEGKMIYLGRTCNITSPDTDPILLKIDANGALQFRAPEEGYIPIGTTGELALINRDAAALKGTYKQELDLNLLGMQQGMESYRALNWEPLGKSTAPFTGEYDGGGLNINYLYISRISPNAGLFGYTAAGAKLLNIKVNSGNVLGRNFAGALCGSNGGEIRGCSVESGVYVEGDSNAGGVAGVNRAGGKIADTRNYGTVSLNAAGSNAGGIAGNNSAEITGCSNSGVIAVPDGSNIGGIAGISSGSIKNCFNTKNGAVSALESAGGIAGYSEGTIGDSRNYSSNVTALYNTGGVAGINIDNEKNTDSGLITGCSNEGAVKSEFGGSNTGGVCGRNIGGRIENSFNTGEVSGFEKAGGVAGFNAYWYRGAPMPKITACYNAGKVTSSSEEAGGVCGNNQGEIIASYNTGSVSGYSKVGGIVGLNSAIHYEPLELAPSNYYSALISACYNTGSVSSLDTNGIKGGIAGQNQDQGYPLQKTSENIFQTVKPPPHDNSVPDGYYGVYFKGKVEHSYWDSLNPKTEATFGIGQVGPENPTGDDTGCTKFSDGSPSASTHDNWKNNYWNWKEWGLAPKLSWEP